MATYKERYLAGEIEFEEIDEYSYQWGMSDDEKMFQIGVCSVWAVLFLSVILQVAFRTQNRQINQIRRDIVKTQQQVAVAEARYASLVSPENLRSMVVTIEPKSEVVSFNKSVAIENLPDRVEK